MRGVDLLARALRPTLGPNPRLVAMQGMRNDTPPFLYDNAAKIAYEVKSLADPDTDVGAMLLRHAVWRVHEQVGDGTATTAVLLQSLLRAALPYLESGGNAVRLRQGLERATELAIGALRRMAVPIEGRETITRVANALCPDQDLAQMLAEILEIVGTDGYVQVELGQGRELYREYVEGAFWKGGWVSPVFTTDQERRRASLVNPAVLLTDHALRDPSDLLPVLETAHAAGLSTLFIVCRYVADPVLGLLAVNRQSKTLDSLVVLAPGFGSDEAANLEDLSALSGARVIWQASGESLGRIATEDLGRAREAWATSEYFGIVGGRGDSHALRAHIASVRAALRGEGDHPKRDALRRRLGRLIGGVAKLRIGAPTASELEYRRSLAERTVLVLRQAMSGGALPGAGSALLACQSAVAAAKTYDQDEAMAFKVLHRALEEPLRTIASNAGLEPSTVVEQTRGTKPGWGLDARTGRVIDLLSAGIVDPLPVVEAALRAAVSGASMVLTTDAVVHAPLRPVMVEP